MQIVSDNRASAQAVTLAHHHHGGWVEMAVLGSFAAQLALLIGERGSVAAILLASLALAFWWYGLGRQHDTIDAIGIGNALGISAGLIAGFPQLLLPCLVLVMVIGSTGSARVWRQDGWRGLLAMAVTVIIAAAGAAWLAVNVHVLPL
mgnify:CR=1 FL=1